MHNTIKRSWKKPPVSSHTGPCRSFKELCDMVSMNRHKLQRLLQAYNGPKPIPALTNKSASLGRVTYYNLAEFKRWWKSLEQSE